MFSAGYHQKKNTPRGKALNYIAYLAAICFSFLGSILTVVSGSISPLLICLLTGIVLFAIFQALAAKAENDAMHAVRKKTSPQTDNTEAPSGNGSGTPGKTILNTYVSHGEDIEMEFILTNKRIKKKIIENRCFVDYPGAEEDERWLSRRTSKYPLENRIYYRTTINHLTDGTVLIIWEIQPDGRYWADEGGYGWEKDKEICLYSIMDAEGHYLHPFRLYSIGERTYYTIQNF